MIWNCSSLNLQISDHSLNQNIHSFTITIKKIKKENWLPESCAENPIPETKRSGCSFIHALFRPLLLLTEFAEEYGSLVSPRLVCLKNQTRVLPSLHLQPSLCLSFCSEP